MKHKIPGLTYRMRALLASAMIALSLLGGCASTNNPRDPIEPVNRAIYQFNDAVDQALLKPVAEGYRAVFPSFVRTGVGNFFSNINDVLIALNNLLQGKFINAVSDAGRVVINTTIGLLGVLDVATDLGLEKNNEDFGQTLGYWGIGDGPFLMVPLLGPSNVRDFVGRLVDYKTDPITYVHSMRARNILWGTRIISNRADLLDTSKILEAAALDPYEFLRDAYIQRRRNLVHDGSPPKEKEDDPEIRIKPRTQLNDSPFPGSADGGTTIIRSTYDFMTPAREEALEQQRRQAQQPMPAAPAPRVESEPLVPPKRVVRVWLP
jgi:phospholipid-binding lipoprotein MlaA